jgi:hypothetical protein
MWEKIEIYFFDIMGLLIPGLVFLSGITFTSLFLLSGDSIDDIQKILSQIAFFELYTKLDKDLKKNIWLLIAFVIFNSYLIGHVIKVMSKVYYWFFSIIFDQFFNKIISTILKWLWKLIKALTSFFKIDKFFSLFNQDFRNFIKDFIKAIYRFFHHNLKVIFVFDTEKYEKANKPLLDESLQMINERYNTNFPIKWYSIYKLSKIMIYHENLKNMNDTFLAKYNFYRSLSFICFLQFILLIYLSFYDNLLNDYSSTIVKILLGVNTIFWYTFHEKYKRYFKLCGNETLVSIYYHLKTTEDKSN